jgi:O-antigen/teichoic acid export membrane protein
MATDSIKASARSGVLWGGASQAAGLALQLLQSIIAARVLGPERYAEIAVIYVVSAIALPLAQSGLGVSIIYLQERDPKRIAQVQSMSILVATAVAALIFLSAEPVAAYFRLAHASFLVKASALTVWFSGISSVWMSLLKRDLIFRDIEIAYLTSYAVGFILVMTSLYLGAGAASVVLGQACAAALNALFLRIALQKRGLASGLRAPGPGVIPHLKSGGINTFSAMTAIISERIDAMMIGGRLSASDFGTYGLFSRVVTAVSTPIQRVKLSIEFSSYAQLMTERERLRDLFAKALGVSALVICPVFLGLAAVSDLSLHVVLGGEWAGLGAVFSVMCVFGLLRIISSSTTPLFMAAGLVRRALYIVFARLILLPPLVLVTLKAFPSIMAVAIVMTALQLVQAAINYLMFARPVLGPCAGTLALAVGRPLAAALVMATGVILLRRVFPPGADGVELTASIALGAVIYVGATLALNRSGARAFAYAMSPLLAALPRPMRKAG